MTEPLIESLALSGLRLIKPRVWSDARGYFSELYHAGRLAGQGFHATFVQDNQSFSRQGVLRGLHFQYPEWQGKLVSVISGEIYDVAVDIRRDSPTFGRHVGVVLSSENHHQLYVPEGYAHGFCVLSGTAHVLYKCTAFYEPSQEVTLAWNDPALGIAWPVQEPMLSDKDARGLSLDRIRTR